MRQPVPTFVKSAAALGLLLLTSCSSETPVVESEPVSEPFYQHRANEDSMSLGTEASVIDQIPRADESAETVASPENGSETNVESESEASTSVDPTTEAVPPEPVPQTDSKNTASGDASKVTDGEVDQPTVKLDPNLIPLNPKGTVLLDKVGKRVLLKTKVCMNNGLLEMLVCQAGSKEHESILSIDAKSYVVHAGLLALGAESGAPVSFAPEFSPPTGEELDIFVSWTDKQGKPHRQNVGEWVRYSIHRYFEIPLELPKGFELPDEEDLRYDELNKYLLWFGPMKPEKRDQLLKLSDDKPFQAAIHKFYKLGVSRQMKAKFIFAGSSFYVDEETNERLYRGEGGYLICVANFPSATVDVAIESSAEGDTQMFEAWTDRVPPIGTDVTVELIPRGIVTKKPKTSNAASASKVSDAEETEADEAGPAVDEPVGANDADAKPVIE